VSLGAGIPEQPECSGDQEDRYRFHEHIPGNACLELRHICRKVHDQVDQDYLDQDVLEFTDPFYAHPRRQLRSNSGREIEGEAEDDEPRYGKKNHSRQTAVSAAGDFYQPDDHEDINKKPH